MGINLSDPFPSDTWLETQPMGMGTWLTKTTLKGGGGGDKEMSRESKPRLPKVWRVASPHQVLSTQTIKT